MAGGALMIRKSIVGATFLCYGMFVKLAVACHYSNHVCRGVPESCTRQMDASAYRMPAASIRGLLDHRQETNRAMTKIPYTKPKLAV